VVLPDGYDRLDVIVLPPWPIQAKLKVGAVDDPLEREADRVAEQVMRMPAAGLHNSTMTPGAEGVQDDYPTLSDHPREVQRKCSCGGSCDMFVIRNIPERFFKKLNL